MAISKIILNGVTQMDVTQDTVASSNLLSGYTATKNDGTQITGSYTPSGVSLQNKSASYAPTESSQSETLTADVGYDGLSSVAISVGAISSTYVGSGITQRSSTDLTVSGATVTAPSGYYSASASKSVASGSVSAPSAVVASNATVAVNTNTGIVTLTKQNVGNVPVITEGYITQVGNQNSTVQLQGSLTMGTDGTPTATKGTVSNHSVSVTPSVTNTTGYITGGTKSGTAVTVSASELVSGTLSVTENGTEDVTNYASVNVNLAFSTIYTGSGNPSSSTGSNGDIYLKVVN